MKRKTLLVESLLILLVVAGLLVAVSCTAASPPSPVPTPTAAPSPTPTPTPKPTPTPTHSPTPAPAPSPTPTPTPSPKTTPTPTSAPTDIVKEGSVTGGTMKVKWFGQASFLITSSTGLKIITDPYTVTKTLIYDEINESADIVTVSHGHGDHSNVAAVGGNPTVVKDTTEVKGTKLRAISTSHDASGGKERGNNAVFCFEVDGIKVCHLGDLGHLLSAQQVADIGKVDVLLIPVGGYYTIDAAVASQVIDQLKPAVAIPMHFKTEKYSGPIAVVDDFLKGKNNVTLLNTSEAEFKAGKLPASTQIMVLKPGR